MKEIIRKYTVNGIEVRVAKYDEDGRVQYHVEHDMKRVQNGDWFGEFDRTRAIMQAQFVAGWIERNGIKAEAVT